MKRLEDMTTNEKSRIILNLVLVMFITPLVVYACSHVYDDAKGYNNDIQKPEIEELEDGSFRTRE